MTELRKFGRFSRKEETTLSTLSDPQAPKFYLKGRKRFVTKPSLIWKLKWGRIHCSSMQDIIIGFNHKKTCLLFLFWICYLLELLCLSLPQWTIPESQTFLYRYWWMCILSQTERKASSAKFSHLALKQLALATVRQHYCRWIAITATHELPAIGAGFTLITGGNAAWHLCDFTHSPSGFLGHATSKNQQNL